MNKIFWWTIISLLVVVALAVALMFWSAKTNESSQEPQDVSLINANDSNNLGGNTDTTSGMQKIKIFMIGIDDNGKGGEKIGCGDSVIAVEREIKPTQAVIKASMEELLSLKKETYGESGLVNTLYQSNLKFLSAVIDDKGIATVKLSGDLVLGGVCDNPRIKAQLEQTVKQFSTVKSVEILINNKKLNDLLSPKGE